LPPLNLVVPGPSRAHLGRLRADGDGRAGNQRQSREPVKSDVRPEGDIGHGTDRGRRRLFRFVHARERYRPSDTLTTRHGPPSSAVTRRSTSSLPV
jgi:hypothetical protein